MQNLLPLYILFVSNNKFIMFIYSRIYYYNLLLIALEKNRYQNRRIILFLALNLKFKIKIYISTEKKYIVLKDICVIVFLSFPI